MVKNNAAQDDSSRSVAVGAERSELAYPKYALKILQATPMMSLLESDLAARYSVVRFGPRDTPLSLARAGAGIAIAVTTGEVGLSGEQLKALPDLRAIANFGAGYDATNIEVARERGIAVSNTPDVLTDCVADLAVGQVLNVMRGLAAADRYVRQGHWQTGPFQLASKVTGKRAGIIGLGRIGGAIARRLEAFNMEISYHNRSPVADVSYSYLPSVIELAEGCDVLVVAAPGGPQSVGLISDRVLEALGPSGFLINVSRGSVVDEQALISALANGTIAGAGLDVFSSEPNVPSQLLSLDNVVLSPHIGSGTLESRRAMANLVLANVDQFIVNGTLVTSIE